MFDGNVYYCWSCDAHCRAVEDSATGACCSRCHEQLSEDCRLDDAPRILSFLTLGEAKKKSPAPQSAPGLWPTRAAAMH